MSRPIVKPSRLRVAIVIAGFAAGMAAPVIAQRPALGMLDQLEGGRWELRVRDPAGAGTGTTQLCMQDGRTLIQLRHPAAACDRLVIDDAASEVTVQYSCRGRGYGRTHIRRESNRLVQIDSQGIADGRPFAFAAEARRVGSCPT